MLILDVELRRLGFRRRSRRYWQCERRYGLPEDAYISIFSTGKDGRLDRVQCADARVLQLDAFHVMFLLDVDNVHFYYHQYADDAWEPGGNTSSAEIARHDVDPIGLREWADAIAAAFVRALDAHLWNRSSGDR